MLASIAVEANKSSHKALERVLKEKGASERVSATKRRPDNLDVNVNSSDH